MTVGKPDYGGCGREISVACRVLKSFSIVSWITLHSDSELASSPARGCHTPTGCHGVPTGCHAGATRSLTHCQGAPSPSCRARCAARRGRLTWGGRRRQRRRDEGACPALPASPRRRHRATATAAVCSVVFGCVGQNTPTGTAQECPNQTQLCCPQTQPTRALDGGAARPRASAVSTCAACRTASGSSPARGRKKSTPKHGVGGLRSVPFQKARPGAQTRVLRAHATSRCLFAQWFRRCPR